MRILKVISLLLDYPSELLRDNHDELAGVITMAREISPTQRIALVGLLDELAGGDLMDVQERYSELFDKGRALSLLLFEHVHGESRDRGQAMVDLMAQYTEAGFAIDVRELPDYIPLYLEYLATRDAVVIVTDHSAYDWNFIVEHAPLVVDTRNATQGVMTGGRVVKA